MPSPDPVSSISTHLPLESPTMTEKWVFKNLQRGKVESPFLSAPSRLFFSALWFLRDYLKTVISRRAFTHDPFLEQ